MAEIEYTVVKRSVKIKGVKQDVYYAKWVPAGNESVKEIAKKSVMIGTLSDLEVPQFLDLLVKTIKEDIKSGVNVQMGDLGTLSPTITCKMVENFDDCDTATVKKKTVRFRQSTAMTSDLKKVSFRKANLDIQHL